MIGVLAVQGDFERHLASLEAISKPGMEVRTADELEQCSHLIIPGGESTTVGKLLQRFGLGAEIQRRASEGMPIWGTCMGMIMMAKEVEDADQYSLGLLDITVRRNAFGRQIHSFEAPVPVDGLGEVMGVFIRAPIVIRTGMAKPLAHFNGHVVAVQEGTLLGTSFHPELTSDTRLHEWFANKIGSAQRG